VSQTKVVELNLEGNQNTAVKRPAASGKTANPLPPIVHTIRQHSKRQMAELLQNLFNNIDDALFELADRSQSVQQQEMYFDSMRMIRLHRKTLASNYMRAFYDAFRTAFTTDAEPADTLDTSDEEADYALLEQDELEMNVAVSGIVSKVTSQYSLAVMQLTKRLDHLAKSCTITERSNPLGPLALSSAFANALSELDVDIKVRIILMKMFERFVMERLGPLYESANHMLIEAGVLPDLKKKTTRNPGSVASPAAAAPAQDANIQTHGASAFSGSGKGLPFSSVQSLLAGARSIEDGMGGLGGTGGTGGTGGNIGLLPPLQPNELMSALNQLQNVSSSEYIDIERVPELDDVRTLVLAQPGTKNKSLGQADDDAVNFVGMLFDYILNDRNLAIPMKALIGRLQIPIVKLAIIDKSFFEKGGHPARVLLNELSSAGIGWSSAQELKRDALYNKIESIVLRVLNEFSDNPDLFGEVLGELREFVSSDTRRSILVEQRVKEAEAGKAKTHTAKLKVQNLVNQKACGLRLPAEAGKFVSEVWTRVLTLRIVKHGEDSDPWRAAVNVLDDLLWALQPLSDLEDVQARDARTPQLSERIVDGMRELGCPQEEIERYQAWLSSHLHNLSENDRAFLEDEERPELDFKEELVEEIVLASPPPVFDESTVSPEAREQLRLITEGSWVEVLQEDDSKLRCKLATVTQPGGSYVFVNRRGMKVLEKSQAELADLVEEEQLKRIDESQVFDRALQSVIGNLRQMQRERSQS